MFIINDTAAIQRAVENWQRFTQTKVTDRPSDISAGSKRWAITPETIFGTDDVRALASGSVTTLKLRSIIPFTVFTSGELYDHHVVNFRQPTS